MKSTRPQEIQAQLVGFSWRLPLDGPVGEDEIQAQAFPEAPIAAGGQLFLASWGLRPAWAEGAGRWVEGRRATLNCRAEEMAAKPSFRTLVDTGRCLIPVEYFVEWRHEASGRTTRYRVSLDDGEPLYLGGLWQDHDEGPCFTVCTLPADPLMAWVHNTKLRMPLVVRGAAREAWLAPGPLGPALGAVSGPLPLVAVDEGGRQVRASTLPRGTPTQGELF